MTPHLRCSERQTPCLGNEVNVLAVALAVDGAIQPPQFKDDRLGEEPVRQRGSGRSDDPTLRCGLARHTGVWSGEPGYFLGGESRLWTIP
jgi:hypothetical protein